MSGAPEHAPALKVLDLGEWWRDETDGLPLPLGVNAVRRDLGDEVVQRVTGGR